MRHSRTFVYLVGAIWAAMFAQASFLEPPQFRPYELLLRAHTDFKPNRRIEMEAYGALSYRYHYPEIRDIHHEVFTTDDAGLRNPVAFTSIPRIVVLGDSFIVGVGLTDDDTFPLELSRRLGEGVYNYGTQGVEAPPLFLADRRFARFPPELALYMPSDSTIVPIVMPKRIDGSQADRQPSHAREGAQAAWLSWFYRGGAWIDETLLVINRDNGLKRAFKGLYLSVDRAVFGFSNLIEVEGERFLATSLDEQRLTLSAEERKVDEVVESYLVFRDALAERGTRLIMCPIPESGEVYEESFPAGQRARVKRPRFREVFIEGLRAREIPVIDLLPAFEQNRRPYLYQRDDPHWSKRAILLAAEDVARELKGH